MLLKINVATLKMHLTVDTNMLSFLQNLLLIYFL